MHIDWVNIVIGTIIGAAVSVPVGLAINQWWEGIQGERRRTDRSIRITSTQNGGTLTDPVELEDGQRYFKVSGHLGFLPEGHEIWLLNQDLRTGEVWPQGLRKIPWSESGEWSGYSHASDREAR